MQRNPRTVTPAATLRDAVEIMLSERLAGLPVVGEDERLLGALTLGYIMRGFTPEHLGDLPEAMREELEEVDVQAFFGPTSSLFLVADFFKQDVVALSPDEGLLSAASRIERQQLGFLPVTEKGRLVGVVSQQDLMQAFFKRSQG